MQPGRSWILNRLLAIWTAFNIGLMALSSDIGKGLFEEGAVLMTLSARLSPVIPTVSFRWGMAGKTRLD